MSKATFKTGMQVYYGTALDPKSGENVKRPAIITLAHGDDTADVQLVDGKEEPLLDANQQPQWFGRVPFSELEAR